MKEGGHLREQLLALSDVDHSFTYNILVSPMPVKDYVATFRLTPITVGNRTFAEWWADFNVTSGTEQAMVDQIGDGVFVRGFEALEKKLLSSTCSTLIVDCMAWRNLTVSECIPMKLGFNLLLWTTHVLDEHVPLFDRLKATGYDGSRFLVRRRGSHYKRLGRNLKDAGLAERGDGFADGQECHRRRGSDARRWRSII